jgi:TolB protein
LSREWRLAIHRVADEIELWLTGERGIAASRIAYVRNGTMRLIDSDGAGETSLSVEPNSLSPAWSRSGSSIAYATFGIDSRLWLLDVATGRSRSILGPTRNVGYTTPAFTSGDDRLVFGKLTDASDEIWSVLIADPTQTQRITRARGESASLPTPSPNDRRVAYVTDILGHPEIYVSDFAGIGAELLTDYPSTGRIFRADPDWSPNGFFIAYQERIDGRFQIRIIPASGRAQPKTLTDDGQNEQPSWAPDSRHIVFTSTRTGVRELWIVDTQSGQFRQLTHGAGARLGAWSPRLSQR